MVYEKLYSSYSFIIAKKYHFLTCDFSIDFQRAEKDPSITNTVLFPGFFIHYNRFIRKKNC